MDNSSMLGNTKVFTTIPSTDLERTRKFYGEKLGLKVLKFDGWGMMLEAGDGSRLFAYKRGPSKADHTLASFEVDDIEAKVNEMIKNGIVFEQYDMPEIKTDEKGIANGPGGEKYAWFKDPD